ncbi:hypothetical protein [Pseudonocardia sp. GCM10023141]|uniref:hypothetical protein n=1 Tax=Pseudonocardia sp. GCM10023141 TaxID=3252653 RepID=UPI00361FB34B
MSDDDRSTDNRSGTEPHGTSHAQQAPGGATSRGPDFGAVGVPQVPIPPYDELRGKSSENTAGMAYDASNAPKPGPRPPVAEVERNGLSGAEMNPEPALGVGKSTSKSAENLAPDRPDTATKGAGRPVGKVAGDDRDTERGPAGPQ